MAIIEYLYAVFEVIDNEYPKGGHHATAHAYAAYISRICVTLSFLLVFSCETHLDSDKEN